MCLARPQLGKNISLVSHQFYRIAFPLMHEEKSHTIPDLKFDGKRKKLMKLVGQLACRYEEVPDEEIPTEPIPPNILAGNSRLNIGFDSKFI